MKNQIVVVNCNQMIYNTRKDQFAFAIWLQRVECIESFDNVGDELHLNIIKNKAVNYDNLRELIGLFDRYKIDMKPLKQFLTEDNRDWFFDNKKAYWHDHVFGE